MTPILRGRGVGVVDQRRLSRYVRPLHCLGRGSLRCERVGGRRPGRSLAGFSLVDFSPWSSAASARRERSGNAAGRPSDSRLRPRAPAGACPRSQQGAAGTSRRTSAPRLRPPPSPRPLRNGPRPLRGLGRYGAGDGGPGFRAGEARRHREGRGTGFLVRPWAAEAYLPFFVPHLSQP